MRSKSFNGRKNSKVLNRLKYLLVLLAILAVEASVFQYRFFQPLLCGAKALSVPAKSISATGDARVEGEELVVYGTATLTLKPEESAVTAIKLISDSKGYSLKAKWHDEGNASKWVNGSEKSISDHSPRESEYYITTQGNCTELVLTVKPDSSPVRLLAISLNRPTYSIRWLRVLLIFAAFCGLKALFKHKPWNSFSDLSDSADPSHRYAKRISTVYLLFMTTVFLLSPGTESGTTQCRLDKLFYKSPDTSDAYMMQTDALTKGQLHLDTEVTEELLALGNPYDPSTRVKGSYTWDFAFFEGKYYSYFGVVPVVLFLLPFRLLTGRFFSSYHFAFLLGLGAAFMLSLVYREAVKRYIPRINRFAYCTGLLALLFSSFLCYLSARSWFYEIPYNSAFLFVFSALFCAFKGAEQPHKRAYFSLAGLFYALSAGCRPISLVSLLLLLPVLCGSLLSVTNKSEKLRLSACFTAPVLAVLMLLGVWNGVRFGSPFDFGNAYQLTVSDIRFNSVTNLAVALDGSFQYLFRLPNVSGVFPFFKGVSGSFAGLSHSFYSKSVVGLISYPVFWWGAALPAVYKDRKSHKELFCFIALGLLAGLATVYSVSATGGVFERYTLDFKWIFALVCVLSALFILFKKGTTDGFSNLVFALSSVLSAVISFSLCFLGEYSRVKSAAPELYYLLKDTFELLY